MVTVGYRNVGSDDRPRNKMIDALENIYGRRSVRSFTDELVSREVITSLIDAAIQAPSAMNEQPWRFTVLTDKMRMAAISTKAKAFMLGELGEAPANEHLRQTLRNPNFNIFYNAPALVVISAPGAVEDCAMAAQNLMLAAHARSLGTCWIGFSQRWLNSDEGHRTLGIDHSQLVVAPIIIGHPTAQVQPVPRRIPSITWT